MNDWEQDDIRATAQRVAKRWTELRESIGKNMVQLFDELNQLGDNVTKTIDQPEANRKVINLFEDFLSPGRLIQKFPDEPDRYLLTLPSVRFRGGLVIVSLPDYTITTLQLTYLKTRNSAL